MPTIYRSDTLLVRQRPAGDTRRWIVTFDHYDSGPMSDDRRGFAEDFAADRGISIVAFLARGNDWFQYRDMHAALAVARDALAGAERIVTYGSSMGAYAAIRFADALGASGCLAISPQYSNDRRKVPFETRWADDGRRIRWLRTIDGPIACSFRPVVISDGHGHDGRHVGMIARDIPIDFVSLPFTGHPVSTYLGDVGVLEQAVLTILDGSFDPVGFHREVERSRRTSAVYLCQLAKQQPRWRLRLAVALARRAVAQAPGNLLAIHVLADKLTAAGAHAEALPLHARVYEQTGHLRAYGLCYAEASIRAGDWQAALATSRDLVRLYADSAEVHSYLSAALWAVANREEALDHARIARRLSPINRHYRVMVSRYRRRIVQDRARRLLERLGVRRSRALAPG